MYQSDAAITQSHEFNYKKNLLWGYIYIFFFNLTFWFGPWLLLYLKYMDYAQVGIIQGIALLTTVLFEIPTGVITDLIGKRYALLISAFLITIGELLVPLFPSFTTILVVNVIIRIGLSFFSGTMDAYMYDSLVSAGKTDEHPKVLSRMSTLSTIAICIASISGGFLFLVNQTIPWYLTALAKFLSLISAFVIIEPLVDTERISVKAALSQMFVGFKHLFAKKLLWLSILVITFGIFGKFIYEILDDTNVVEFGMKADQIGTFFAFIICLTIPISYLYDSLQRKIKPVILMVTTSLFYALLVLSTPFLSLYTFIISFSLRNMLGTVRFNSISQLINKNTPSKIRATTLSTIELVNSIPFVLLSFPVGTLMSKYSARAVTGAFGLIMLIMLVIEITFLHKNIANEE